MHLLAKNVRTCSKSLKGAPDQLQLYKNGVLNWDYLVKTLSFFLAHPEEIKQKLKAKDAHMLCQFFDSEEYKSRVSQFLETQGRILSKDTIDGIQPPSVIKYQHVLSCAQPIHKKTKLYMQDETGESGTGVGAEAAPRKRKARRGTIIEEILKRRGNVEMMQQEDDTSIKNELKLKKNRQRSTIMPIFLKKIKQRQEREFHEYEEEEAQNLLELDSQTARRLGRSYNDEPMYAQLLQRSSFYNKHNNKEAIQIQASSPNILTLAESQEVARSKSADRLESNSSKGYYMMASPDVNGPYKLATKEDSSLFNLPYKMVRKVVSSSLVDADTEMDSQGHAFEPADVSVTHIQPSCRNVLKMVEHTDSESTNNKVSSKAQSEPAHYKLSKANFKLREPHVKFGGVSRVMPKRMASSTANMNRKPPTLKLFSKVNMNLKSYSDFLCLAKSKPDKIQHHTERSDAEVTSTKNLIKPKRFKVKAPLIQMWMEEVQKRNKSIGSLQLVNNLEKNNTMMQVKKNIEGKRKKRNELHLASLFEKVKMGL